MNAKAAVFSALLILSGCATTQPVEQPAPSLAAPLPAPAATKKTHLEKETSLTTPSGATFTAPGGWQLTELATGHSLQDPDGELSLVMIENAAPDAAAAVELAWKQVRPDFARAIKRTIKVPPRQGFEEVVQLEYETSANEARVVIGLARRKGAVWYVALLDGTAASFDRRAAQAMNTVMSLKVAGAEEESFAGKSAHPLRDEKLKAFDAFISEALQLSGIPGAAVAVVQDGRVVLEKGYGTRELNKSAPVTPSTLFMIGSTTKSLTTLMMARLVDEGRFSWDTPVKKLLPTFALGDEAATNKLQMFHTVCACTGLPRQDFEFIFEYANVTPEMRLAGMRSMKPTTGFGETFQYSNSMVSAGGYVAALAAGGEKSLGRAYDGVMQSRLFGPLGMKDTTLDFRVAAKKEHATPHGQNLKLEYAAMPLSDEQGVVPVRPAGGAWSNVQDMSRYVLLELRKGELPDGQRFVSEANLLKRREPQVKITDKAAYGLGLFLENEHGIQVVGHGGNNLGFTSDLFFLPEHGVGVVLLANAAGANGFRRAVRRRLLELLFDGKEEARQSLEFGLKQRVELTAKEVEKVEFAPEAQWFAALAGRYQSEGLGTVELKLVGGEAIFDAGEWKARVARKKEADGTLKLILASQPLAGLEFLTAEADGVTSLVLQTPQQKYEFKRVR